MISSNISKRHKTGMLQVRLRIPDDLQASYGRKELTRSLGTRDARLAKKLARPIIAAWEADFEDRRRKRGLTDSDMDFAATEHYRRELDADQSRRIAINQKQETERAVAEFTHKLEAGEFEHIAQADLWTEALDVLIARGRTEYELNQRAVRAKVLAKHLGVGESALIEYAADEFIQRHQLTIGKDSVAYRELCHRLLRGEIEFLKRTFERDQGNFGGVPSDPIVSSLNADPFVNTTFANVIDLQESQAMQGIGARKSKSTLSKYRNQTTSFTEWRRSTRISTVTLQEVENWRDHLLRTDKRKTVRDKLATIKTVLKWGIKQSKGKLFPNGNPLDLLEKPIAEQVDSTKRTYTLKQAASILKAARKRSEPHYRWIPWLAAYSGARINELTVLEKRDFFRINDDWFYHIRVEGERTTKTMQGRKVPVHPALVEEGLIDFVQKAQPGRLFTERRIDQKMRDWIRVSIFKLKPDQSGPPPNHAFRHLFEDLRRFVLDREAANYITGRANAGSDSLYGKSDAMLPALAAEMRKFPDFMKDWAPADT